MYDAYLSCHANIALRMDASRRAARELSRAPTDVYSRHGCFRQGNPDLATGRAGLDALDGEFVTSLRSFLGCK